jgi:uncharacterized repeat protein (TIGR03803 family)
MKKIYYRVFAWCCALLCIGGATAQERLMFSVTYNDGLHNGLYYLNKDGSGGAQPASEFSSSASLGEWPEYFIVSKDGEIVGINSAGGTPGADGEGGFGTLYRVTARGVVKVQDFNYAEASQTFITEGWSDGKLYGTGPQPISDQILQGTKYLGLTGYEITKYGFRPAEVLAANNGGIYGVAPIGGTNSQGYLYKFSGTNIVAVYNFTKATGHYPQGQLMQGQDGYIYGVTKRGGKLDYGVIYKIRTDGTGYQVLYHFDKVNGMYPDRGLVQDAAGNLYGMTFSGGSTNLGVVYKIRPDGTGFTKLHDFTVKQTYYSGVPQRLLLDSDGFLYGRVPQSQSLLFRIKTDGSSFKVIFNKVVYISTISLVSSITPTYKVASPVNGATGVATSPTIMLDSVPGAAHYRLEVSVNADFVPLISDGTSGQRRFVLVGLNPATKYYVRMRTSLWARPGPVTSFTTASSTSTPTSVVTTPSDGSTNAAAPTLKVTVKAVTGAKRYSVQLNNRFDFAGTMFTQTSAVDDQRTLTFSGLRYNTKYYARVKTDINETFGPITSFTTKPETFSYVTTPSNAAIGVDRTFVNVAVLPVTGSKTYTMQISTSSTFTSSVTKTFTSLDDNQTTFLVSDLKPSTQYFTRVRTDISTGYGPVKSFTTREAITPMRLVGANTYGGAHGFGALFSMSIDSMKFTRHYDITDMYLSFTGLVHAPDGFYGARYSGTTGAVYKYNFETGFHSSPIINIAREAEMMMASNGMLYLTPDNAPFSYGAIYKMSADLSVNNRIHFFKTETGLRPHAPLLEHSDGYLYGTTIGGGLYGKGVIFKMKGNGSNYQPIFHFNFHSYYPAGGLTDGHDGYFYGTTNSGDGNYGAIYKVTYNGSSLIYLHTFMMYDGSYPMGELLIEDGIIYGTTSGGGTADMGVLFKMKTDGTAYTILKHFDAPYSANPTDGVVSDGKGMLYGFLTFGGSQGFGSIYRIKTDGSSYQVLYEMNGDSDISGIYPYGRPILTEDTFTAPAAMNVVASESQVQVYPNPSESSFRIRSDGRRTLQVELTDFTGAVIYQNTLSGEELNIGESLRRGIYILRVTDGSKFTEQKLIKK